MKVNVDTRVGRSGRAGWSGRERCSLKGSREGIHDIAGRVEPRPPDSRASRGEQDEPLIVGLGGTTRANSSTERALEACLETVKRAGARTVLLGADDLVMPMYAPELSERSANAERLVAALREADGVIVASPGYHGGFSGLIKNALDYVEDLRQDDKPYLDGRAVGCIVCAYGWQASVATLAALRSVVHALRGWPTPLGAAINSANPIFDDRGKLIDSQVLVQLELVGGQVLDFARGRI